MRIFPFIALMLAAFLLQGCYWYETLTLSINIESKTGKVEFGNVVSIPDKEGQRWKKKDIQQDWEEFLKAFNENGLMDNKDVKVTNKQLLKQNKQLNAIVQFNYNDLADLDIKKSADHSMYLVKKDINDKILETNGKTVVIDSVEYISWSVDEKEIFIKYQLLDEDKKRFSLLRNYEKWAKQ